MIVALFPGQGSQTPGFLSPWLDLDGVDERLDGFSEQARVDLRAAGTTWDADRIRDTKVAQPLIVAASLISFAALLQASGTRPTGVAGHSVGELAALAAAGVLAEEDAVRLVGIRGRAMAEAADSGRTGMSAVVGGNPDDVLEHLRAENLTAANFNGGGQIVAAGTIDDLARLAANPPRAARVIPLQVAGAFHTDHMAPAVDTLRTAAEQVAAAAPALTLWTNRDGTTVDDGRTAIGYMVEQVASPVRWDLCMQSFADHGVTGLIEMAPAGALVGLAKRGLRGVPAVAMKTPDDLAAAAALLTGADA